MFNILKNVIRNGGMPLTQVNERIETMYISGRLNSQERSELIELMHSKADPANETGDWKKMYEALAAGDKETGAKCLGNILRLRDFMLTVDLMPAYSAAMNLLGWEGIFNQDYCTPYSEETKEKIIACGINALMGEELFD